MNVFEHAMQMEKDGEAYYRELAEKTQHNGHKTILNMLADEEVRHYNTFKGMMTGKVGLEDTVLTGEVKNVFQQLREDIKSLDVIEKDHADLYAKARQVEADSEAFYREKAEEMDTEEAKAMWNRIADEEHKHFIILDNMIEMLQSPDRWIEDAEWHNLDKEF